MPRNNAHQAPLVPLVWSQRGPSKTVGVPQSPSPEVPRPGTGSAVHAEMWPNISCPRRDCWWELVCPEFPHGWGGGRFQGSQRGDWAFQAHGPTTLVPRQLGVGSGERSVGSGPHFCWQCPRLVHPWPEGLCWAASPLLPPSLHLPWGRGGCGEGP